MTKSNTDCPQQARDLTLTMSLNVNYSSSAPHQSTARASDTVNHSGKLVTFQLPPAIDFDAYRTLTKKPEHLAGKSASDLGSREETRHQYLESACHNSNGSKTSRESSHSSLRSLLEHSQHVNEKLSAEDYVELGKYAASFNTNKKNESVLSVKSR